MCICDAYTQDTRNNLNINKIEKNKNPVRRFQRGLLFTRLYTSNTTLRWSLSVFLLYCIAYILVTLYTYHIKQPQRKSTNASSLCLIRNYGIFIFFFAYKKRWNKKLEKWNNIECQTHHFSALMQMYVYNFI